jgi:hypothetical protein
MLDGLGRADRVGSWTPPSLELTFRLTLTPSLGATWTPSWQTSPTSCARRFRSSLSSCRSRWSAEVVSVDGGDEESVSLIRYSGADTAVTFRSRWQDRGGRPVIVAVEPAG